jgi:hypothetical protein
MIKKPLKLLEKAFRLNEKLIEDLSKDLDVDVSVLENQIRLINNIMVLKTTQKIDLSTQDIERLKTENAKIFSLLNAQSIELRKLIRENFKVKKAMQGYQSK